MPDDRVPSEGSPSGSTRPTGIPSSRGPRPQERLTLAASRGVAAAVLLIGLLALVPSWVHAEPPSRLDQQVTDTVGALTDGRAEVDRALAELQSTQGLQLWVAYVDSFDGRDGTQWADQTAQLSGLGGNDLLFAVAIGDRAYGYSLLDAPVDGSDVERIMARNVEPRLAAGDWPGAVVALAEGLAEPSGGGGGGLAGILPWLVGGAVILLVLIGFAVLRRRRNPGSQGIPAGGAGAPPAQPAEPIEGVRQRAAAALIDADDSVKTSEQELGFAVAQFGDESAAPFTAALAQSKDDLAKAFHLQRRAQEAAGHPEERALLDQVIALCAGADARLDDQVEAFDKLRDLERTIDTVLPALGQRTTTLEQRLDGARQRTEDLARVYPGAALDTVTTNLSQAEERIRFARDSVTTGGQILGAGDRLGAVARARAAEEALGQATTLLDGVDRAPAELAQAREALTALLAETAKDVAEAERLGVPAEIASAHRYAADTLDWARQAVASGTFDPLATRRALEESDSALESLLVPLRAAQERQARAVALLASASDAARASVQAADDYITTRRGAVGAEARTRLAEAQRQYAAATAQAQNDPAAALAGMQQADHLADQALAIAQQDEARYNDQMQRGGSSGGLNGMILGGILLDSMMRGGGGRGGGFGMPGPGIGRGAPRRTGPGSFGGGATRGRRSGGGRF